MEFVISINLELLLLLDWFSSQSPNMVHVLIEKGSEETYYWLQCIKWFIADQK